MNLQRLVLTAALLAAATPAVGADSCNGDIVRVVIRINAELAAIESKGPVVPQSSAARLHHQPTPGSIAAAESRAGVLPARSVKAVEAGLARARKAARSGDQGACEQALAQVQRLLDTWPE
jgi:hypothetical protein